MLSNSMQNTADTTALNSFSQNNMAAFDESESSSEPAVTPIKSNVEIRAQIKQLKDIDHTIDGLELKLRNVNMIKGHANNL